MRVSPLVLVACLGSIAACASPPPKGRYGQKPPTSSGDGDTSSGDGDTSSGDGDTSSGDGDAGGGDGDTSSDMVPIDLSHDPAACKAALKAPALPFGSHKLPYAKGSILPNHVDQKALDQAVADYYDDWKAKYLKSDGCGDGRVYVASNTEDTLLSVSEAHGYGMLITVLMAGHDPDAQKLFDGMVAYFKDHPTDVDGNLMAWAQDHSCKDSEGADSATDGDLDMAYALLLADKQWGSGGAIDYGSLGRHVAAAVLREDVQKSGTYLLLGNWVDSSDSHYDSTRTSDFMPGHLATFSKVSGDAEWKTLLDKEYTMVQELQGSYAKNTGLLPDFVIMPSSAKPMPAPPNFLEHDADGEYGYNACRDPWRIALHFLTSGDTRAKTAVELMNKWIEKATGGDPDMIIAGYDLDGTPLREYASKAYTGPFGVASIVDASHQDWANALWDTLTSGNTDKTYFSDTLQMLSLIAMSGNWWAPESAECPK